MAWRWSTTLSSLPNYDEEEQPQQEDEEEHFSSSITTSSKASSCSNDEEQTQLQRRPGRKRLMVLSLYGIVILLGCCLWIAGDNYSASWKRHVVAVQKGDHRFGEKGTNNGRNTSNGTTSRLAFSPAVVSSLSSASTATSKSSFAVVPPPPPAWWLESYVEFHRTSLQRAASAAANNFNNEKKTSVMSSASTKIEYLQWSCDPASGGCGGIADRLHGIVSAFYMAVCTGRVFLIDWEWPFPLDEGILEPSWIRWNVSVALLPQYAAEEALKEEEDDVVTLTLLDRHDFPALVEPDRILGTQQHNTAATIIRVHCNVWNGQAAMRASRCMTRYMQKQQHQRQRARRRGGGREGGGGGSRAKKASPISWTTSPGQDDGESDRVLLARGPSSATAEHSSSPTIAHAAAYAAAQDYSNDNEQPPPPAPRRVLLQQQQLLLREQQQQQSTKKDPPPSRAFTPSSASVLLGQKDELYRAAFYALFQFSDQLLQQTNQLKVAAMMNPTTTTPTITTNNHHPQAAGATETAAAGAGAKARATAAAAASAAPQQQSSPPQPYIGVHIRTGGPGRSWKDPPRHDKVQDWRQFYTCARNVQRALRKELCEQLQRERRQQVNNDNNGNRTCPFNDVLVYVASDNQTARTILRRWEREELSNAEDSSSNSKTNDRSNNLPQLTIRTVEDLEVYHVDRTRKSDLSGTKDAAAMHLLRTWAEWKVLMDAACVVTSRSGFGITAAQLLQSQGPPHPPCAIAFDQCSSARILAALNHFRRA